jgi:hypothetical protein
MGGERNWLKVVPSGSFGIGVLKFLGLVPEGYVISTMNCREIGRENLRWMELAQNRVHCWALFLAVLNLLVLLPEG